MNAIHYEHQSLGKILKLLFELMQIHLHWFSHANTPMTGQIKILVLCDAVFPPSKNSRLSWHQIAPRENISHKRRKKTRSSLEESVCQWHLYLLPVTSLFNIFIWKPINKKRGPRLGRNPSKFNLCVHKALHLSKWHFPISAFDSIDFFFSFPSSLRPLSMHGWNNKGSWVGFSVWTEHGGTMCFLTVETQRWSI